MAAAAEPAPFPAFTTLTQSGHLVSLRGRAGGTFVAEAPPLAEAAESPRLVAAMTEVPGGMSELIAHIAHPPAVLERANRQHERLIKLLRKRDAGPAVRRVREHLQGTEHILGGLLP